MTTRRCLKCSGLLGWREATICESCQRPGPSFVDSSLRQPKSSVGFFESMLSDAGATVVDVTPPSDSTDTTTDSGFAWLQRWRFRWRRG